MILGCVQGSAPPQSAVPSSWALVSEWHWIPPDLLAQTNSTPQGTKKLQPHFSLFLFPENEDLCSQQGCRGSDWLETLIIKTAFNQVGSFNHESKIFVTQGVGYGVISWIPWLEVGCLMLC